MKQVVKIQKTELNVGALYVNGIGPIPWTGVEMSLEIPVGQFEIRYWSYAQGCMVTTTINNEGQYEIQLGDLWIASTGSVFPM